MFLKVVIYRNVAFTHSNTQKDITEVKQRHAICLGTGLEGYNKFLVLITKGCGETNYYGTALIFIFDWAVGELDLEKCLFMARCPPPLPQKMGIIIQAHGSYLWKINKINIDSNRGCLIHTCELVHITNIRCNLYGNLPRSISAEKKLMYTYNMMYGIALDIILRLLRFPVSFRQIYIILL